MSLAANTNKKSACPQRRRFLFNWKVEVYLGFYSWFSCSFLQSFLIISLNHLSSICFTKRNFQNNLPNFISYQSIERLIKSVNLWLF
jgi:hypothetical protein